MNDENESEPEPIECPVCWERCARLVDTGCTHGICARCVLGTFQSTNWTCPCCRRPVPRDRRGALLLSAFSERIESACHLLAKDPQLLNWDEWRMFLTNLAQKPIATGTGPDTDWSWVWPLVQSLHGRAIQQPPLSLPTLLWTRIWELLQTSHTSIHPALWTLAVDWVRRDSPCSMHTLDRHWRAQPELRELLLQFQARLFEERHASVAGWTWQHIERYCGDALTNPEDYGEQYHFVALCVLANWVCGNPARGAILRQSPLWPRIWTWFETSVPSTPLSTATFQVLCNAAGPAAVPCVEDQWALLERKIWKQEEAYPRLFVRRSILLAARFVRTVEDLYWVAQKGYLVRLVQQFGAHPLFREDLKTCLDRWHVLVKNEALWKWVMAACGWDAAAETRETRPPEER